MALTVVAWRRFGSVYGLFSAVSLAIPLSTPNSAAAAPLATTVRAGDLPVLPRARLARREPKLHTAIVAISAAWLGLATV